MNPAVGVDCVFEQDGRVRVRRVKLNDEWLAVEQGRQWRDENGRHFLIIVPGLDVQEILLAPDMLQWRLLPRQGGPALV